MKQVHYNRPAYLRLTCLAVLGLLIGLVGTVAAQKSTRKKSAKAIVKQTSSICGTLVEKRGNQMPGPGRSLPAGRPVVREVAVFTVLTTEQVVSDEAGFITDLKGMQPLQTVQSGSDGKFCFNQLPAGQYSVLVHEKQGWYTNSFDAKNRLNPVTVQPGKTAAVSIEITHAAAF